MSLVPLLYDILDDEPSYSFGLGYHPHDLHHPRIIRNSPFGHWPSIYRHAGKTPRLSKNTELSANPHVGNLGFQVNLDVQHFLPNEITVKTVDNNIIEVEGKHDAKEDQHGEIYRHFIRRYTLPDGYDVKDVISTLSSDGVLTVKAPPKSKAIESNERVVQIQQTGPAHISVKDNSQNEKKNEEKMTE